MDTDSLTLTYKPGLTKPNHRFIEPNYRGELKHPELYTRTYGPGLTNRTYGPSITYTELRIRTYVPEPTVPDLRTLTYEPGIMYPYLRVRTYVHSLTDPDLDKLTYGPGLLSGIYELEV